MRVTTRECTFNNHTLEITLIHYSSNTVELAWSIDYSYKRVELSTAEKNFVKTMMSRVVTTLSTHLNIFVELYTDDGLGDMRHHIHSKWGFNRLGTGPYMVLGNEVDIATAISNKLSVQVG